MSKKIIEQNGIPQCPYCEKPTHRTSSYTTVTAMYFPPRYDENGININPDRNSMTTQYTCLECNKSYVVSGNVPDGFYYANIK